MARDLIYFFIKLLFRLLSRLEVVGLENIPPTGGAIVSSNHVALIDAPLVFSLLKRKDATALVAKKHQKNPFLRMLIDAVHGIWINRDEADSHAMRAAIDFLQKGGILGIAPEGTRSRTGCLTPGKTGVAYLADKAGVPVVPIAITGTRNIMSQFLRFRRPHIVVRVGEPFYVPHVSRKTRDEDLHRATDEIMCRIASMLPEESWGVYAGHPRLNELLTVGSE